MIPGSEVLKVLVEECGWNPSDDAVEMFGYHYNQGDRTPLEYRFMGALGFGGKLHMQGERIYVSCYQEDETPARREMINRANVRLKELTGAD